MHARAPVQLRIFLPEQLPRVSSTAPKQLGQLPNSGSVSSKIPVKSEEMGTKLSKNFLLLCCCCLDVAVGPVVLPLDAAVAITQGLLLLVLPTDRKYERHGVGR